MSLPPAITHPTGLPEVGDLYWLNTACYGGNKKDTRPGVVIRAPLPGLFTDAKVIVRTSRQEAAGVHHPVSLDLNLDRPGVFPKHYVRTVDERFFKQAKFASYQGKIDEATLTAILQSLGLL